MEELWRNFSISRITIDEYKVPFEIPNNCTYKVINKDGVNVVTIELTVYEADPSKNYTSNSFSTRAFERMNQIEFNQKIGLDSLASVNKN